MPPLQKLCCPTASGQMRNDYSTEWRKIPPSYHDVREPFLTERAETFLFETLKKLEDSGVDSTSCVQLLRDHKPR